MRWKLALAVALCLALVAPAGASGAQAPTTSNRNTVAYFTSRVSGTEYYAWVLGIQASLSHEAWQQPVEIAAFDLQVYHNVNGEWVGFLHPSVDLTADQYRFPDLSHAWVDVGLEVDGRTIDFDIAWIGLAPGENYIEAGDGYTWVGRVADAHVTGTITDPAHILSIDDLDPTGAILRTVNTH